MRSRPLFLLTLAVSFTAMLSARAQTGSTTPGGQSTQANAGVVSVIGEVKSIDTSARQMIVRTDNGSLTTINLSEKTQYWRVAPGEKSLTNATKITLADVGEGDRILAQGRSTDQKSVPAQRLVVMTKADLAKKQEKERIEWRRRGISGIVASLNPSTKEITVSSRSLMGAQQSIIVPITDKVMMRRYPPDTIPKYSEAKPSKFEEVKTGDQFRALGDKSEDGTHLTAEEVVFGSFRIAGGTVTAIDAAANQIKINDLQTKKPLTIVVKPESVLRRFDAAMLGGGGMGQGSAGGSGQSGSSQGQGQGKTAGNQPQGAGPGGPQGGGTRGGGMNMADVLERLPVISINDVKVGDTIIMSSLQGSDPTQLTAISLVTGIEPLLQVMAARQQAGGQARRPQAVDLNSSFGGMFGGVGVP